MPKYILEGNIVIEMLILADFLSVLKTELEPDMKPGH